MSKPFEDAIHGLRGHRNVVDIRNLGMVAAIELDRAPARQAPGRRSLPQVLR